MLSADCVYDYVVHANELNMNLISCKLEKLTQNEFNFLEAKKILKTLKQLIFFKLKKAENKMRLIL